MNFDKQTRNALLIVAIFASIILIGQSMIYVANPYHCDMHVERIGSEVEVQIDTNYSLGYTINSLRTDSMSYIESYAIFYDESYPVNGDLAAILDAIKRLQLCFSNDNTPTSIINATDLQKMMSDGKKSTAILFMTGTLPEDVYNGSSSSLILTWLENGGIMYWLHGKLGTSYAQRDGELKYVEDSDQLFFGNNNVINGFTDHVFTKNLVDDSLTYRLGIYYGETTNGVDCSRLTSPYLALDYNDGTYSAVTLIKYFNGDGIIGVFGGELKYEGVPTSSMASVAQTIVSKLSYDTTLIDYRTGSGNDKITMDCGDGFSYIFMYVDRVNAIWAKTLPVNA